MTTNQKVVGSNPAGLTRENPYESTFVGVFLLLARRLKSEKTCKKTLRLVVKTVVRFFEDNKAFMTGFLPNYNDGKDFAI